MNRKTLLIIIGVMVSLCVATSFCGLSFYVISRIMDEGGSGGWGSEGWGPDVNATATAEAQLDYTPEAGGHGSIPGDGTLRLPGGVPPTLDPAVVQDATSAEYIVHLYSGLVRLNKDLEVELDLAESLDVSVDGLLYTFTLRPNAQFADGKTITAETVAWSIERACSLELDSPVAGAYLDDIVGAQAYLGGQADSISGLTVIDERTLQIEIDEPKAYFLAKLTYPTSYAVDRERVEQGGDEWWMEPNGSGPYTLAEMAVSGIVLERNEGYYGDLPDVRRVEFDMGSGLAITMYENDELDITYVGPSELVRVTDPYNALSREVQIQSELSIQYLALNVNQAPFDDPLVRKAFAQAINRERLADVVLLGTATAAKGILPPEMPGYDPDWPGLQYDPAAAREALAQSSYGGPDGLPELVLTISGASGAMDDSTQAILAMLEENLGVAIRVEQVEWAYFLRDLNLERYQMYSSGWIADYPDPHNFLDMLFHSASSQNHSGYANAEVDALLEKARVDQDEAQREALYRQAERQIIEDAPWVPLTHGLSYSLVKEHVEGYQASAGLYPWLLDVRLVAE